ncbi:hypothetical protein IFM89_028285 [Coptis chinensis]|uniref:SCP domain-containing protein n=1 Tax=Coptis chinensis TaxID=261450 RepID=A0A835LT68_9MAGN|nr:hypothetical protein IFM89_028285 [Coptis chinensis]
MRLCAQELVIFCLLGLAALSVSQAYVHYSAEEFRKAVQEFSKAQSAAQQGHGRAHQQQIPHSQVDPVKYGNGYKKAHKEAPKRVRQPQIPHLQVDPHKQGNDFRKAHNEAPNAPQHPSQTHNGPVSQTPDTEQEFLKAHNAARALVGVAPMTWDNTVAATAQNYANKMAATCNMVHSTGPYGENLAKSTGVLTAAEAVTLWVNEKQFYNVQANSCNGGQCLHYTQVIWRKSVRLGCARESCSNGGTFIVCNYDPPGNYIGQNPFDP